MPGSPELAESLAREVVDQYLEAERLMTERIARNLAKGIDAPDWAEKKLAQMQQERVYAARLLASLKRKTEKGVSDALSEAYERGGLTGARDASRALMGPGSLDPGEIGLRVIEWRPDPRRPWVIYEKDGRVLHRFDTLPQAQAYLVKHTKDYAWALEAPEAKPYLQTQALEKLTAEVVQNVTATHTRILRSTLDAYRSIIGETASQVLLGTETRRTACQAALNRFAHKGITGFIDKAGRRWDLASYTEMAMRTGTAHAAVQGHVDRLGGYGLDLVMVTNVPGECERCRPLEGKVYSTSGRSADYPSLDSARAAGLFHPGCRHDIVAYIPGVTKAPTRTADPEGDAARQKQRYLERQVRASKRMEAAALDDQAARNAQGRVRAYQAKLREHVEATDGKRLYYREQIGKAH